MTEKKYLVDCCNGTKYYVTLKAAQKQFYNNDKAHTLAKKVDNVWYPISEKIYTK